MDVKSLIILLKMVKMIFNERKKMTKTKTKITCVHCKSDQIEYVPAPFQGQDTWFDVRYEQQKNGTFKAVIRGDTQKKEKANVNKIGTGTIYHNDPHPLFHCLACTAELDGFADANFERVQ